MDILFAKSAKLIAKVSLDLQRELVRPINWEWRLNGIVGARGTGKTTLLLQRLNILSEQGRKVLYVSLDDFYFTENRLYELAVAFYQSGGQYLFLDEVHKYPTWPVELKNIYDTFPDLKITFSGSSITEILRQDVDLSRRALFYELSGLSFREFLQFSTGIRFTPLSFEEIVKDHSVISSEIAGKLRPLEHFHQYLQAGYYPYFLEKERDYQLTLEQVIQLVLEVDMKYVEGFDPGKIRKMMQLLRVIASSAPFKPNVSKLSERIGINRNTLIHYLNHLQKARLICLLNVPDKDLSVLQKPDKVLLSNTNLFEALVPNTASKGSLRETFFASQVVPKHELHLHRKADFIIDYHWVVEVGGKTKENYQIKGIKEGYLALDDLEVGYDHKIPLWLFGFLY